MLVTYRPEDATAGHPLRLLLGDAATAAGTRRMALAPLSLAAVRALASTADAPDAARLHEVTGGNPFFVTEVLAAGGSDVPATVRDAVVARVARLSPPARHALDAVALAGARAELSLLEDVLSDGFGALDEPLEHGVLRVDDGDVDVPARAVPAGGGRPGAAGPPAVAAPAAARRAAVVGRGRRRGRPGPAGPPRRGGRGLRRRPGLRAGGGGAGGGAGRAPGGAAAVPAGAAARRPAPGRPAGRTAAAARVRVLPHRPDRGRPARRDRGAADLGRARRHRAGRRHAPLPVPAELVRRPQRAGRVACGAGHRGAGRHRVGGAGDGAEQRGAAADAGLGPGRHPGVGRPGTRAARPAAGRTAGGRGPGARAQQPRHRGAPDRRRRGRQADAGREPGPGPRRRPARARRPGVRQPGLDRGEPAPARGRRRGDRRRARLLRRARPRLLGALPAGLAVRAAAAPRRAAAGRDLRRRGPPAPGRRADQHDHPADRGRPGPGPDRGRRLARAARPGRRAGRRDRRAAAARAGGRGPQRGGLAGRRRRRGPGRGGRGAADGRPGGRPLAPRHGRSWLGPRRSARTRPDCPRRSTRTRPDSYPAGLVRGRTRWRPPVGGSTRPRSGTGWAARTSGRWRWCAAASGPG